MKTIKLVLPPWQLTELFNGILPLVRQHFSSGGHRSIYRVGVPYAVHIGYTEIDGDFGKLCEECGPRPRKDVYIRWDYKESKEIAAYQKNLPKLCTRVIIDSDYFAEYCPRHQVLLGGKLESDKGVEVFQKLYPHLVSRLDLREVPPEQKRLMLYRTDAPISMGCILQFEQQGRPDIYSPVPATMEKRCGYGIGADEDELVVEVWPPPAPNAQKLVEETRELISKSEYPLSVLGDRYRLIAVLQIVCPLTATRVASQLSVILDDFLARPVFGALGKTLSDEGESFATYPEGILYGGFSPVFCTDPEVYTVAVKIAYGALQRALQQGELTYNDPPARADYVAIGLTNEEYDVFENFLRSIREYDGAAINEKWSA